MFDIILAGFMFFNVLCSAVMIFMAFMFIDHPVAGIFWFGFQKALKPWLLTISWAGAAVLLYVFWHYQMQWSLFVFSIACFTSIFTYVLYFINRKRISEVIEDAHIYR